MNYELKSTLDAEISPFMYTCNNTIMAVMHLWLNVFSSLITATRLLAHHNKLIYKQYLDNISNQIFAWYVILLDRSHLQKMAKYEVQQI